MKSEIDKIFFSILGKKLSSFKGTENLNEIKGWGAFTVYRLLNRLEDRLDINFSNQEIAKLETIGDFKRLLNEKIKR